MVALLSNSWKDGGGGRGGDGGAGGGTSSGGCRGGGGTSWESSPSCCSSRTWSCSCFSWNALLQNRSTVNNQNRESDGWPRPHSIWSQTHSSTLTRKAGYDTELMTFYPCCALEDWRGGGRLLCEFWEGNRRNRRQELIIGLLSGRSVQLRLAEMPAC